MPGIQSILHPTDFSENARPAFQTACTLALASHATLLVLHVMMPSVSPLLEGPLPDPRRTGESERTPAQLPWPEPADPRIRVEHRLTEGDPAEEILRLSKALGCDLVVMGTHGRTGLRRFLTGSVAEEVLRKAACPVLVVKSPLGPTPAAEVESIANLGDLIDVRPLGNSLTSAHTQTLARSAAVEVVRVIVRAGQEVRRSKSRGETLVQCLEGRVALASLGKTEVLEAGKLLQLPANEPYAFKGIEDASLLLTILAPK